ncbi:type II toxin-antitoxin system HicB family antitoxin [Aquincola tertiaricarbonis]|uniref:Type II toxin-antitoxin system HicB family antitoxin n=1 Tax=Aquincola tertiaricarbonis TaxID=391953 RepID=A0ABY4SBJ3_AQUTE|nr:toxin-antitoxin system HicB family antitoxin [Aquincola tertiaricarbonis]URI10718.1 type II toxin-antitoxin system HicB family antitoxin [Aquincola tertiaricarbonis]
MNPDHYTYRVTWSAEDDEHVGLCAEFPSLSWLAKTPEKALAGMRSLVADCVRDMQASGEFKVRIPPQQHRRLAIEASEQGVSLNRLVSAKLAL